MSNVHRVEDSTFGGSEGIYAHCLDISEVDVALCEGEADGDDGRQPPSPPASLPGVTATGTLLEAPTVINSDFPTTHPRGWSLLPSQPLVLPLNESLAHSPPVPSQPLVPLTVSSMRSSTLAITVVLAQLQLLSSHPTSLPAVPPRPTQPLVPPSTSTVFQPPKWPPNPTQPLVPASSLSTPLSTFTRRKMSVTSKWPPEPTQPLVFPYPTDTVPSTLSQLTVTMMPVAWPPRPTQPLVAAINPAKWPPDPTQPLVPPYATSLLPPSALLAVQASTKSRGPSVSPSSILPDQPHIRPPRPTQPLVQPARPVTVGMAVGWPPVPSQPLVLPYASPPASQLSPPLPPPTQPLVPLATLPTTASYPIPTSHVGPPRPSRPLEPPPGSPPPQVSTGSSKLPVWTAYRPLSAKSTTDALQLTDQQQIFEVSADTPSTHRWSSMPSSEEWVNALTTASTERQIITTHTVNPLPQSNTFPSVSHPSTEPGTSPESLSTAVVGHPGLGSTLTHGGHAKPTLDSWETDFPEILYEATWDSPK